MFAVLRKKERAADQLVRRYKNHSEKLRSGDIYQVAEVVRNLSIRDKDKGLSAGEKRMLYRARQILVSEPTSPWPSTRRRPSSASTKPCHKGPWLGSAPSAGGGPRRGRGPALRGYPSSSRRSPAARCRLVRRRGARCATASSSSCPPVRSARSSARTSRWPGGPPARTRSAAGSPPSHGDAEVVVIHDAARPLADPALFAATVAALDDPSVAGAVTAVEVTDTVKRGRRRGARDAPAQRPSGSRRPRRRSGPTCCAGPTRPHRRRPTTPRSSRPSALPCGSCPETVQREADHRHRPRLRRVPVGGLRALGQGLDVHRFSEDPDARFVLGGVEVPGARGLEGHSDADALAHAVADALLGAAGLGDLGTHFPDPSSAGRGRQPGHLGRGGGEVAGPGSWP